MIQVQCERCRHFNPATLDRCEHCFKKLDDEKAKLSAGVVKKGPPAPIPAPVSPKKSLAIKPAPIHAPLASSGTTSPTTTRLFSAYPLKAIPSGITRGWGLPNVEGVVEDTIDTPYYKQPSTLERILKGVLFFVDFKSFMMTSILGRRQEKDIAFEIRVETVAGPKSTFIKGDVDGPIPQRGDYIAIWGYEEKGVVQIKKIFNCKTGAETTRK